MKHDEPFTLRPFRPAWWLPGAHGQTVAGRYARRFRRVRFRRERLETPDGDFLDLDHASLPHHPVDPDAPLAVVVHGLEGSSASSYVLETCRALAEAGIGAVALNFRGCSGEPNRTARFYHAGETGDLALVLDHLAGRSRGRPLLAVGYSLGGNVLLKYLGETGDAAGIAAAVAVSVPYDLGAGADQLDRTLMGRLYTGIFVRSLRRKYRLKRELLAGRCDDAGVAAARSFRAFDDAATAPLHGFRDVDHYYTSSSAAGYLHRIRIPTLLLQGLDDPFVARDGIPRPVIRENPFLYEGFLPRGGHVGFIAGPPWRPEFWAEREAARFLAWRARRGRATAAAAPQRDRHRSQRET
jgi:uncharacterized protein